MEGVDRAGKSTQAKKLKSWIQTMHAERYATRTEKRAVSGGSESAAMEEEEEKKKKKKKQNTTTTNGDERTKHPHVEVWRFPDRTTAVGKCIDAYLRGEDGHNGPLSDATVHLLFSANRWERAAEMEAALASGTTLILDRYCYSGAAFTAAKKKPGLSLAWCKSPDAGLPAPDLTFFLALRPEDAAKRAGFGGERYETPEMQKSVTEQFALLRDATWVDIDAGRDEEEVHMAMRAVAEDVLNKCREGRPIRRLWLDDDTCC